MKKILQKISAIFILLLFLCGSASAQVYHFQEGFPTNAPPAGWITTNVAWSLNHNNGLYTGIYSAKLKPNESSLICKVINTADLLQFYCQVRDTTAASDFHLMIEKSTNKLDWTEISRDPFNMADTSWQVINLDVKDNSPELYLRFHATALGGTAALGLCYIDDVSVTKLAVSPSDATLTDLTYNGISVDGFTATTLQYYVELPYYVEQIVMEGTPNNPSATKVKINPVNLRGTESERTGKIVVTAPDGVTTKTYEIIFTVSKYIYYTGFVTTGESIVPFENWTTSFTWTTTNIPMSDHAYFTGPAAFKFVRGQEDKAGYLNTAKYIKSDSLGFWLAVDQSDGFEKLLIEKKVLGGVSQTIANLTAADMSSEWKEFKYAIKENDSTEIIFTPTITAESTTTRIYMDDLYMTGKPVPQGIEKIPAGTLLTMHPNPAVDYVTINVSNPVFLNIDIYDMTGNKVYSSLISPKGLTVDLKTFSKGIYFVSCRSNNSICTGKLIIN